MFLHSEERRYGGLTRMTMERFSDRVLDAASARNGQPIMGSTVDDARLGVCRLFSVAERSVDILSGSLNPRIYGAEEVVAKARLFLARSDANLRIILESDDAANLRHPLLEAFSDYPNLEVRILDQETRDMIPYHFMVVDSSSYRFKSQKQTHAAMIAFGDAAGGQKLSEIFQILWYPSTVAKMAVAA